MLGAAFHLFILSLQTPIYETDENKIRDNLRLQNAISIETVAVPMYEEDSDHLYP